MTMQVIGLTGFAGAGKSTVANYLVEKHGFTRLSFAGPLKKMLRTLDPVLETEAHDGTPFRLSDMDGTSENVIKELYPEYRRLLQVLGTDCIRAVDQDFWVKAAVAQMTDEDGKYVFDDVRFPNEAETIKHQFNYRGLWNIMRPGYGAVNGHASEQHAGSMGEYIVLLNNSLDNLHRQIAKAVDLGYSGNVAA